MINSKTTISEASHLEPDINEKRKVYVKPLLHEIGDLRTVTLGPSLGNFESGDLNSVFADPKEPG